MNVENATARRRTVDFRPAPKREARAIFIDTESRHWYAVPIVGWIVQEYFEEDIAAANRERCIIAAVYGPGSPNVIPLDEAMWDYWGTFWYIDCSNSDPSWDEIDRYCSSKEKAKEKAKEILLRKKQ